jgi:hypothetical protein
LAHEFTASGNEVVVLKRWLADLLNPRQEASDAHAKKLNADDLVQQETQAEPHTTEALPKELKAERQNWLKWMRSSGQHDRLIQAGFRCESRRYVLRSEDKLLVFWRNAGIQVRGCDTGMVLTITFDWLLPITSAYPFHNRDGFPRYMEHFPISVMAAELQVQRQRYRSPNKFRYHLNFEAREVYPTRCDSERDFPFGTDGPFDFCIPRDVDIALTDGLWLLETMSPTLCLEILSGIRYDGRTGWDKKFENAIRERVLGST